MSSKILTPGLLPVLCVLSLALIGCGGDDDKSPTSTAAAVSSAALDSSVTQAPLEIVGSTATDGICQITIPDSWVDDGSGRGATAEGDHWLLFGGSIASDADWTAAKDLLKSQLAGKEGALVDEDDDRISISQANGRGYVVRQRFERIYCEFSVTAVREEPDPVTTVWLGVAATLEPKPGS
jgi:hypothetical protein